MENTSNLIEDIPILIDEYYAWLKQKTTLANVGDWVEITSPYLDRHNDHIQIFLKENEEGYLLTDDGATIAGLEQDGCSLQSPKRLKILSLIANGYGLEIKNEELQVKATKDNFSFKKHSLMQAILAVNDMFYLSATHTTSLFLEDVREWLDDSEVRYTEQIPFIGKSGLVRKFDFVIPKSPRQPERIIKTINNPIRANIDSAIMGGVEIREIREDAKAYVLMNDEGKTIPDNITNAFRKYEIAPVLWSQKENFKDELMN